jgi:hypothetical protein
MHAPLLVDARMRRTLRLTAILTVTLGSCAWFAAPVSAMPTPAQPQTYFLRNHFLDVAGTTSDAWLVGESAQHHGRLWTAIVEHYTHGAYRRTYIDKSQSATLESIRRVSDDDMWAAGQVGSHELIVQYDGRHWTSVPVTNPPPSGSLGGVGVGVVDADDVWFVGGTGQHALAEHWIGTRITRVKDPVVGYMNAVSGDAPDDVWAAGVRKGSGGRDVPVVEHWNGSAWTEDDSFIDPNRRQTGYGDWVSSVVANGPDDVWVFGSYGADQSGANSQLLVEHWDGTAWTVMHPKVPGRDDFELNAASALSADDIWVGGAGTQTGGEAYMCPLLLHWDGSSWSSASAPSCTLDSRIQGLTVASPDDMWAAMDDSQFEVTYLEHWDGTQWTSP